MLHALSIYNTLEKKLFQMTLVLLESIILTKVHSVKIVSFDTSKNKCTRTHNFCPKCLFWGMLRDFIRNSNIEIPITNTFYNVYKFHDTIRKSDIYHNAN